MKENRLITLLAAGAVSAIALTTALAQTSSTTTTVNPAVTTNASTTTSTSSIDATGTITAYTPGSDYLSFRTTTSAEPVRYYYSPKETVLVDSEGATVDWKYLRTDMPVKYTYVKEGDRLIVRKITLVKPVSYYEKETTTTTTTTRP
ncbi:MAG: hypothetical protein DME97_13570 [Verrucomicrobia bacterium]|nr:MAG: hypothetical protein DME97_13570 [Verrucomicrobiota bacterium]